MNSLEQLLKIGSPALSPAPADADALPPELRPLLARRNGFYAFEGALHVFADAASMGEIGLRDWNSPELWRGLYGDLAAGHLFFAEDVFGSQFSIVDGRIATWDPETGDAELLAGDVEEWASELLADFEVLTGQPLATAWQELHGPLPLGERLLPTTPFVLGGEFAVENLSATTATHAMRVRGGLVEQLRDLPDGTEVRLRYA